MASISFREAGPSEFEALRRLLVTLHTHEAPGMLAGALEDARD